MCVCMCVCERESRDTRYIKTENTQVDVYSQRRMTQLITKWEEGALSLFGGEALKRGAQTADAYMREGVTNESKSHPLVRGS